MQHTAHVSFGGAGLILPVHTPYERELVFEHIEASAKHHGHIELSVNGHHWSISHSAGRTKLCARCRGSLHHLVYRDSGQNFCGRCVCRALI